MMISFDEAFSWINKFEDKDSNLSEFNKRIVSQLEIAYKNQDTTKVHQYLNLLLGTATKLPHGNPEKSEIYFIIAKYEYLLHNYAKAIDLIMDGKSNTYPLDEHNMGVAEWLLGCVLFQIPEKQNSAISAWQKSKNIFESLSDTLDIEKEKWYRQEIEKMEDSLLESIGQMKIPVKPKQRKKAGITFNGFAVMRITFTNLIPARALSELISLIDDIYCGHLRLSLADLVSGNGQFPDTYELNEDEKLYISRLEIGTQNFIEFFGQAESLIAALCVIGGAIGLGNVTVKIIKSAIEIKNQKKDFILKQLFIIEIELDIKQKQEEYKTRKSKPFPYIVITEVINIRESTPNFEIKAKILAELGKISSISMDQYVKLQEAIQSRVSVFPAYIIGVPTITLIIFDDE